MNTELKTYIDNSKLAPFLSKSSITDISYNGVSLFYQDNIKGRAKANIDFTAEEAIAFIRQIANMAEKQFSYQNPILDISVANYRINAVHSSIVRLGDEKSISFCIRIGSIESRILHNYSFMNRKVRSILKDFLKKKYSIVIAGETGTGKTELQKYLLSSLEDNTRIIIIDNIQELDSVRQNEALDITSWQLNPNVSEGTFERLIRNALRSNPDWLVIAESRGKEMNDVLNSVLTGHPIITTLHAYDINSIPARITRMVEMSDSSQKYDDIYHDVMEHMKAYIFLKREVNHRGNIVRYISEIAISDSKKLNIVYKRGKYNEK